MQHDFGTPRLRRNRHGVSESLHRRRLRERTVSSGGQTCRCVRASVLVSRSNFDPSQRPTALPWTVPTTCRRPSGAAISHGDFAYKCKHASSDDAFRHFEAVQTRHRHSIATRAPYASADSYTSQSRSGVAQTCSPRSVRAARLLGTGGVSLAVENLGTQLPVVHHSFRTGARRSSASASSYRGGAGIADE